MSKQESVRSFCDGPEKPIIYKALEFARAAFGDDYVLVRESRTYFYLDGRISRETLVMETPFQQLVRAFNGDFRRSGKRLIGLFKTLDQARECAWKMVYLYGKSVEISGNQIVMRM